jgi:hypothetical protein
MISNCRDPNPFYFSNWLSSRFKNILSSAAPDFSNSKAVGKTESSFIPALLISTETVSNVLKIPYNFAPLVLG